MNIESAKAMQELGQLTGGFLRGGEVIELIGDVGAGKTTFVRGLARGLDIEETVQSPSFTINRVYDAPYGLRLVHYDFYRLDDPGIMADEMREMLDDERVVVVIEWAEAVTSVLPEDRLVLTITATEEDRRIVDVQALGDKSEALKQRIDKI